MKIALVALFIILFIYLIIHMCAGSGERGVHTPSEKGFGKTMTVLDGLQSLNDHDLSHLKDDLWELKSILDKKLTPEGIDKTSVERKNPRSLKTQGGKKILQKISKDLNRMENRRGRSHGNAFSKFRVIFVEIALIVITILMIVL